MRKFASLVAAGAMLLSSTAAFAANEGALAPGGAANVKEAQAQGFGTLGIVVTTTVIVTVVVVVAVQGNSSTGTT
ncbi:MAG TPA: hypothetical protein VHL34_23255 [Rhizomicrobium sp.]|jgi:hypothetical protein|nr:hypothetical protein [Rhizomicrobium sp.]